MSRKSRYIQCLLLAVVPFLLLAMAASFVFGNEVVPMVAADDMSVEETQRYCQPRIFNPPIIPRPGGQAPQQPGSPGTPGVQPPQPYQPGEFEVPGRSSTLSRLFPLMDGQLGVATIIALAAGVAGFYVAGKASDLDEEEADFVDEDAYGDDALDPESVVTDIETEVMQS